MGEEGVVNDMAFERSEITREERVELVLSWVCGSTYSTGDVR